MLLPLPVHCRFRHCGAVWDKKLLVIGGMAVWEAPTAQGHTVSDRVMLFDPVSNSWQLLPGVFDSLSVAFL
jgi:hypothetical protein